MAFTTRKPFIYMRERDEENTCRTHNCLKMKDYSTGMQSWHADEDNHSEFLLAKVAGRVNESECEDEMAVALRGDTPSEGKTLIDGNTELDEKSKEDYKVEPVDSEDSVMDDSGFINEEIDENIRKSRANIPNINRRNQGKLSANKNFDIKESQREDKGVQTVAPTTKEVGNNAPTIEEAHADFHASMNDMKRSSEDIDTVSVTTILENSTFLTNLKKVIGCLMNFEIKQNTRIMLVGLYCKAKSLVLQCEDNPQDSKFLYDAPQLCTTCSEELQFKLEMNSLDPYASQQLDHVSCEIKYSKNTNVEGPTNMEPTCKHKLHNDMTSCRDLERQVNNVQTRDRYEYAENEDTPVYSARDMKRMEHRIHEHYRNYIENLEMELNTYKSQLSIVKCEASLEIERHKALLIQLKTQIERNNHKSVS